MVDNLCLPIFLIFLFKILFANAECFCSKRFPRRVFQVTKYYHINGDIDALILIRFDKVQVLDPPSKTHIVIGICNSGIPI